jgi:hypothetical protein
MMLESGRQEMDQVFDEVKGYRAALFDHNTFIHFWPQIQAMMDRVPASWEHLTKDEVEFRVLNDTIQVWGVADEAIRMVLFTQVAVHATGKALQLIWSAGEGQLEEKIDALETALEHFAKKQGCKEIDVIGRFGWERHLLKKGFKRTAVILTRKIIHEGMQ